MLDIKRKVPRFNIEFKLSSNNLIGEGKNISQKGMGFITTEEIIPAFNIPFHTIIKGYIFSNKVYKINGVGNLLYSKISREYSAYFYNGFEFTKLSKKSNDCLLELLEDLRKFEKDIRSGLDNKNLSDFLYFPSDNLSDKTELFSQYFNRSVFDKYEMFSYYLDNKSSHLTDFVNIISKEKKEMIMMGSNNYLGLTEHPDVIKAGCEAMMKYGTGNGSGAMVGGTLSIHKKLESELAEFTQKEDAIIFNSGYSSNLGIISGLLRPQDVVINDVFNHASIFDGGALSTAKRLVYNHNDILSVERILKRAELKYNGKLFAVNGVFSSNGEIANLKEIIKLAKKYNCMMLVDEAHGLGILGENGIGASEYHGVLKDVDIYMGTMSKSLAGVGGFASAKKEIINYLRFYSHPYLFSTNIPPSVAGSVSMALHLIRNDSSIRENLFFNINYFKNGLKKLNLEIGNTEAAIVPIYIPDQSVLFRFSKKLFERGVYHNVFSYPAVPMGGSLLRFGIMATHTEKELRKVLDIIEKIVCEEKDVIGINSAK